ncbi:MAG TPA: hypothetical protein VET85_15320, partial [Stellaceae bacterium]|nr:hypothetical protein [Stellaceae bacterium]
QLFPGFEKDLAAAGAVPLTAGLDVRVEPPGYDPFPQRDLGWTVYSMSRPLIEFVVRKRLEQVANVTVLPSCRVREILAADGKTVSGVRCDGDRASTEILPADFVVDASGQGALTLSLLEAIGLPRPAETVIGVDIGYSTAIFDIPDDAPAGWKGVMTFPKAPESSRGALLLPLEGRRWMLSLGGRHSDKPPGDPDGFMAFTQGLRTPTIYDAVRHAKRVSDVARFAFPGSVRRQFQPSASFPRGLLPVADAICRFNPVYGQGMSVAAQEAVLLERVLGKLATSPDPLGGLAKAFFAEVQTVLEAPWELSAIPDFVFPDTEGQRPPNLEMTLKFARALTLLASRDPEVHKLNAQVQGLLRPRTAYLDPALMQRVMAAMAEV